MSGKSLYLYEDWTCEEIPRCFYIGIGTRSRIRNFKRNHIHEDISKRFGLNRKIFMMNDRQQACNEEIQRIAEHHSFIDDPQYSGIGANLTTGGEHPGEMSSLTRKKMSESHTGSKNHNFGKTPSESTRKRMSNSARTRPPISDMTRQRLKNRIISDEQRMIRSENAKQRAKTQRLEWNSVHEKTVMMLNSDGICIQTFPSIEEAALKMKMSRTMISLVLNGHRTFAKGYKWSYVRL